jgi:hypothetical protein
MEGWQPGGDYYLEAPPLPLSPTEEIRLALPNYLNAKTHPATFYSVPGMSPKERKELFDSDWPRVEEGLSRVLQGPLSRKIAQQIAQVLWSCYERLHTMHTYFAVEDPLPLVQAKQEQERMEKERALKAEKDKKASNKKLDNKKRDALKLLKVKCDSLPSQMTPGDEAARVKLLAACAQTAEPAGGPGNARLADVATQVLTLLGELPPADSLLVRDQLAKAYLDTHDATASEISIQLPPGAMSRSQNDHLPSGEPTSPSHNNSNNPVGSSTPTPVVLSPPPATPPFPRRADNPSKGGSARGERNIVARAGDRSEGGAEPVDGSIAEEQWVGLSQLRWLLWHLQTGLSLQCIFLDIDSSGNGKIDLNEFKQAVFILKAWGVNVPDPVSVYHKLPGSDRNAVDMEGFLGWALPYALIMDKRKQEQARLAAQARERAEKELQEGAPPTPLGSPLVSPIAGGGFFHFELGASAPHDLDGANVIDWEAAPVAVAHVWAFLHSSRLLDDCWMSEARVRFLVAGLPLEQDTRPPLDALTACERATFGERWSRATFILFVVELALARCEEERCMRLNAAEKVDFFLNHWWLPALPAAADSSVCSALLDKTIQMFYKSHRDIVWELWAKCANSEPSPGPRLGTRVRLGHFLDLCEPLGAALNPLEAARCFGVASGGKPLLDYAGFLELLPRVWVAMTASSTQGLGHDMQLGADVGIVCPTGKSIGLRRKELQAHTLVGGLKKMIQKLSMNSRN